jgi:hypothetical protein
MSFHKQLASNKFSHYSELSPNLRIAALTKSPHETIRKRSVNSAGPCMAYTFITAQSPYRRAGTQLDHCHINGNIQDGDGPGCPRCQLTIYERLKPGARTVPSYVNSAAKFNAANRGREKICHVFVGVLVTAVQIALHASGTIPLHAHGDV